MTDSSFEPEWPAVKVLRGGKRKYQALREAAVLAGQIVFDPKEPCRHGHVAMREVTAGKCVACYGEPKTRKPGQRFRPDETPSYGSVYYHVNRERILAAARAKHDLDPEKRRKRVRSRKAVCPEIYKAHQEAYRAKKREALGKLTAEDVISLIAEQKGRCAGCGNSLTREYHIDHVLALSKGGSNERSNCQLLCGGCNKSKGNKDNSLWNREKFGRLL
jgi:5-methylcytosine-specific restriction endonuclease McrA